jgi:hypothetical protein
MEYNIKTLEDVLIYLSNKELQVKLLTGFKDSINGYGCHVIYYIEVFKTIQYCDKCRLSYKIDYSDLHKRHSHKFEQKCIYSQTFMDVKELCLSLINTL